MTHKTFDLGHVLLDSGQTLRNGQLAFQTYGTLSPAGDNVVVMPTFFTGSHQRNEGFFGAGRADYGGEASARDPEVGRDFEAVYVGANVVINKRATREDGQEPGRGDRRRWPLPRRVASGRTVTTKSVTS